MVLAFEKHFTELLPGRRLVLTRGEDEDEFERIGSLVDYISVPGSESIYSEIKRACARDRAGILVEAAVLIVHTVLV